VTTVREPLLVRNIPLCPVTVWLCWLTVQPSALGLSV
jgi:hypothetical protein